MTDIVHVPFYGDTLEAVQREDGIWLIVKRACENVGLSPDAQRVKLKDAPWATTAMVAAVAGDGKSRDVFALHLKSVPMWLATIDASRVNEAIRPKLERYQCEAADALAKHFMGSTNLVPVDPLVAQAETALALTREFVRLRDEQVAIKKAQEEAKLVQASLAVSVKALEASEAGRKAQEAQAIENLRQLPSPTVEAADRTLRSVINECVRQYAITNGGGEAYQAAWSKLYRELRYRYHVDVRARAKHGKMSCLDVIEQAGLLEQLYAIATDVLLKRP
jgi:hypothetical protein